MTPVDTAWLRMDSPGNLMMIVGIYRFDGTVDIERLRAVLLNHFCTYREMRSRVVVDAGGAWWEETDLDMDQHLVRIALPGKADTHELQHLAAQLASQSLDHNKPLWQMHLVENFRGSPEADVSHAMIVRIHHCIADGIALIGVLLSMTTAEPDAELPAPKPRAAGAAATGIESVLRPFTAATVKALDAAGDFAARGLRMSQAMLEDPNLAAQSASEAVRMAARVAQDAAALALMASDTPTSLKGKPSGSKVVAWNEPLPLADVKAVGKAIGCSVNDVLLACVAGAFRGYLLERGEDLAGAEMRAMVPVNLRGGSATGAPKSLGNKFGLVPLLLPIGIDNPVERVFEVRRRMDELKGGYMPVLAMAILGATGLVPAFVQRQVLDLLANKATAVMTNVPGPQQPRFMAGTKIKQILAWVPQSGNIGIGVSILSYDGGVQFGLITDKKLCAHPQAIIDRFAPEFESLVHGLLLMPWDEDADPAVAEKMLGATEQLARAASRLAGRGEPAKSPAGGNGAAPPDGATEPEVEEKPAAHGPSRLRRRRSAFSAARAK
jgi:WS/DGAT/MGAT family acyltransferase